MRYKNFLYLSQRCKKEFNKKRPCKFSCSVFNVFSVPFSGGFSYLEKHYKGRIRLCEFYKGVSLRKQVVQKDSGAYDDKVRTRIIVKDIDNSLDYYRRCLMLLDFYKKV